MTAPVERLNIGLRKPFWHDPGEEGKARGLDTGHPTALQCFPLEERIVLDVSGGSDKNGKKGILSVECLEKM